jgi:putative peptidoglycan lipid II flippase
VTALRVIWTLTIPAAAGLVLLGQPAIVFLLQGGAFTAESTALVYTVLLFFAVRIVSEATLEIVARLFYAQHNTRTPMFAYLVWLAVQVGGAYALVDWLGVGGLALASTLAFTTLAALLFGLNWRQLGGLDGRALLGTAARALLCTALMRGLILLYRVFFADVRLFLFVGGAAGAAVYLLVLIVLRSEELAALRQLVRRS